MYRDGRKEFSSNLPGYETQFRVGTNILNVAPERKNGIAWLQPVVWKFGGTAGGTGKGSCPLSLDSENVKNIMLSYPETRK
jgi:hypothetical protein